MAACGFWQKGRQQLETALRRAAVACYAAEGIYPPTLAYLTEHYGVQVAEDRYYVFYEVFAENLMPEITVLEKGYETGKQTTILVCGGIAAGGAEGMICMDQSIYHLYQQGKITKQTALEHADNPDALLRRMENK